MALISVIEFHFAVFVQAFKFLQLLSLIYNRVAAKVLPWGGSYSLISCVNADKKV